MADEPCGSSSEGSLFTTRSVVLRVECIPDKEIKVLTSYANAQSSIIYKSANIE